MEVNDTSTGCFYTPSTICLTPYTITLVNIWDKMKKALILRVQKGINKTETTMFQGISAVFPKLYLGGQSDGT